MHDGDGLTGSTGSTTMAHLVRGCIADLGYATVMVWMGVRVCFQVAEG